MKLKHWLCPDLIPEIFQFELIPFNRAKKVLHLKKPSTWGSNPATILKRCVDTYLPHLKCSISYSFQRNSFLKKPKNSEVNPLYKKLYLLQKDNY